MLEGEKVLLTGATGKIAFPIARALAARNDVWGVARLGKPGDRERLADARIHAVALDVATGDFSSLPDDFSYVFHAAVDPGGGDWRRCVRTNAHNSGELLYHCRNAKGFVYCSTGSIYGYQGQRPLAEADGPGVPLRANYSFSKAAGEAVCTWVAEHFEIPLAIIRICSTYGPLGGTPADRLDAMLQGRRSASIPTSPTTTTRSTRTIMSSSASARWRSPADRPIVVNWAGSETVSVEDYCAYMGELVGVEPIFEYTPEAHTPLWPDVTYMHEVLGHTRIPWREGFRRMIKARHPELVLSDER